VADYPFTTLKPALGVVSVAPGASFVLVDIPGLIEGAADGKGLGHRFLRHIERTRCLVFTLDASNEDPYGQYKVLRKELEKFHPLLLEKPKLIVLSKCDLGDFAVDKRFKKEKCPIVKTSSATGLGLDEFKREAHALGRGSEAGDSWAAPARAAL
jgi:GTP-binding protein